jgi:CelD/BcsL family acetyltransferase involved in cellulose biosynthesis
LFESCVDAEPVTKAAALDGLRGEWNALASEDSRDGFFRTATWYLTWMRCVRPDARPFVITVRGAGGRLLGLAPLCLVPFRDLGFSLAGVGFGGREVVSGDFLDFPSVPSARAEVIAAALECLSDLRRRWSILVLGELLAGGDLHAAVEAWAQRKGFAIRLQEERICPYIALPDSFEEYLRGLSSATRYHIRRRAREVLERHGCQIELCSKPDEVRAGLESLIRLHLARWRHVNDPGSLDRPGFARFLQETCAGLATDGGCRIHVVKHEGLVVAALLAFHFGQSALYYQAGWDPGSPLHRSSPGVVLMARSIEDAIERGLRYYEFLRGDETYKGHWTKTYRRTVTVLIARTLPARAYVAIAGMKDTVKQLLQKDRSLDTPGKDGLSAE